MDLQRTIKHAMKAVGGAVGNVEKNLEVTLVRENVEYDPNTGDFNHKNPKVYRIKGLVLTNSNTEQDIDRQKRNELTVLISYKDLPEKLSSSDKVKFDNTTHFVTSASLDPSSSLHRLGVRSG